MCLCFLSMILNGSYVHTVIAGKVSTVDRLRFSEPVNLTNNQHDSVYIFADTMEAMFTWFGRKILSPMMLVMIIQTMIFS